MNQFIEESTNKRAKDRDITFHYTNEQMVKDLIAITPIIPSDTVLDAGSGKNKVWYNNLTVGFKSECELEDGCDFLQLQQKYNWVVGNPPFAIGWKFVEKAVELADKGVAFLGNINFFNCLNQNRLQQLADKGWYINKVHIVSDKRWFGRYYYIILTKDNPETFTWNKASY